MIFDSTGEIAENFFMLGRPLVPIYLLDAGEHSVIFDAGFSIMGSLYLEDIKAVLGDREPSYLILTHSHFDHCGAAGFLKKAFPKMSILASPLARNVLTKPKALELIRKLSQEALPLANGLELTGKTLPDFFPFPIDATLSGGDTLSLGGGTTIQVHETPGHSRDSLSFYIPEKGLLICGEALGIPDASGYIISECPSNYDHYADSLNKLQALRPEIICLGHYKAFSGPDVTRYIDSSQTHCRQFKELVEKFLSQENGDMPRVMARFKKLEYEGKREDAHPEAAYYINLKARINAVLSRKNK